MPEYGQIIGTAVNQQYDQQINDLYRQDQMRQRSQAIGEAKTKMFIDDIDFQNAMNEYDAPRVKEYAKGKIMEIAQLYKNNPNLMSDPNGLMQLKLLKNDLKSNQALLKGLATDEAFKRLNADMAEVAKNPNQYDVGAYEKLLAQKNNYLKFGNQDGELAAKNEGEKVFIYSKPQEFKELDKAGLERGNKFKGAAMDIEYLNNGRDGAYRTVPKKAVLDAEAQQFYNDNKRQFDVQYTSKGKDPVEAARQFILGGIDSKFDIGERNTFNEDLYKIKYAHSLKEASGAVSKGGSAFKISIANPRITAPAAEDLSKTFGGDIAHYYTDAKGNRVRNTGDVFNYEGVIYDKGYRQDHKYDRTTVKELPGYIYKSLEWADENGFLYDKWVWGKNNEIKPGVEGATVVDSPVNEKGESHKLLRLRAVAEADVNDPYVEAKFNKLFLTTKQRDAVGVDEGVMDEEEEIRTNKNTGKRYKKVSNGWEEIN